MQAEQAEDDDGESEADLRAYVLLHPACLSMFSERASYRFRNKFRVTWIDSSDCPRLAQAEQAEVDDGESEADLRAQVFLHPFHDQRTTRCVCFQAAASADMEEAVLREGC